MASTTIGRLNAILTLNSAAFNKGLQKAGARLNLFRLGSGSATAALSRMGAVMTTVGAAAVGVMVRSQLKAIDATAKMSKALGIATEALTALQFAASISGVEAAELEAGLRRMEKSISDASVGLTTAVRALDSLGLSSAELDSLSPEEQFKRIAEAFRGLSSQAEKARVAQDLFGRGGARLIPLLNEGAAGIEALMEQARRLGVTFDEEAAAKVEAANDAMTRFKALITGAVRKAAIELAPFIEALADRMTALGLSGGGVGEKIAAAFGVVLKVLAKTADFFSLLKAAFFALQSIVLSGLSLLSSAILELINGLEALVGFFGVKLPRSVRMFADEMSRGLSEDAVEAFEKSSRAMDEFLKGAASERAEAFIRGIREGADKAAEELARRTRERVRLPDPADPLKPLESDARRGGFIQGFRSRLALGAPEGGPARRVPIKGDEQQTALLVEIRNMLRLGAIPARAI